MNADAQRRGEVFLCESGESARGYDVRGGCDPRITQILTDFL
jgi:hypothetical protein